MAWLVPWCRGVRYGAEGRARRHIPGSWEGGQDEMKEYGSVLRPLSRSLTLIAFGAAGSVSLTTFSQVTCAGAVPVVPLWVPSDLVPWSPLFSDGMGVGSGGIFIP